MRTMRCLAATVPVLLILSGCIVRDELTTLTICPDGAADLVILRSNIRSTKSGDAADQELAKYRRKFEEQGEQQFTRIEDAGGEIVEAAWIRRHPPFSNFIHAHLPDASSLERYGSSDGGEDQWSVATRFQADGSQRRLEIEITPPEASNPSMCSSSHRDALRQRLADGISETRIATVEGTITAAHGFTVADDKQSALLATGRIIEILEENEQVEPFLEWAVE
ncbi:MAG: hypothetical protein DWQ34_23995 [Planctomycetota bacterium]|nr:MAG: hypothetical protein DWQ34_23995 [Planctomycetota bacterium]REK27797.1 MAG: hypothetical protein DWQ41_06745 [Planctomycetota bacterium]REK34423.1 MAG: hypothetical protein DWQ45_13300 [Planctomycetota bacterium]